MHERIKDILLQHEGENNPITSSQIAHKLRISEDDTHSITRNLILETAKLYGLPVAATNQGYFIITTEEEYNKYMTSLNSRISGIEERKKIITTNFKRK